MKRLALALTLVLSTLQPAFAAFFPSTQQFGGDGSNGNVQKSGTETTVLDLNANKFEVLGGQTWTVKSGTNVKSRNTATVAGTINVDYAMTGEAQPASLDNRENTLGMGAGWAAGGYHKGGTGGGFGGLGGNGSSFHSSERGHMGGRSYTPWVQPSGSCGGHGGWNHENQQGIGGAPGSAGGCLRLVSAGAISIPSGGVIHIDGGNGGEGSGTSIGTSGGGGGSGGYGLFASLVSVTVTATNGITAKGGNGGNGNGSGQFGFPGGVGGSGGGGGYLVFIAPSVSLSGGVQVNGGSPGTPTSSAGGSVAQSGGAGVSLTILQRPTYPLLAMVERGGLALARICQYKGVHCDPQRTSVRLTGRQAAEFLAAWYGDTKSYRALCQLIQYGEVLPSARNTCYVGDFDAERMIPCS